MRLKLVILLLTLFCVYIVQAQEPNNFGKLTHPEKNFTIYEKDSTANAVVLYEIGNNYFEVIDRRIQLVKKYHVKIKILNEKGFDEADISIPYYKNNNVSEKVKDIKAVTHNGNAKIYVSSDNIFTNNINERWSEKRFTFSKVEKGSIIEYKYTLISPFSFKLDGWEFQSNIPKLYSEFNAKIPGNYIYNRTLIGTLKLDINDASVKKDCFHVDGTSQDASCEVLKYVMKNIPSFKEEENYMLAASNYISRLDFELSEYHKINGGTDKYTKTWKDVDKEFRYDKDIGRQLTKKGFFEKNVPGELLTSGDALTRAKNIYSFIQNHFTWDGRNSTYGKARVKEAFNAKKGNAWEINMSLINLLNAAGIKVNLILSSTRKNGLPKRSHPVLSDFNYVLAKVEIEGENYVLDATDKFNPFGILPFRTLNHHGRVMDFKNESYWYNISPESKNRYQVRTQLKFDAEEKKGYGIIDVINLGYYAIEKRRTFDQYDEETYLDEMEKGIQGNFNLISHNIQTQRNTDTKVTERFEYELENILTDDFIYLNPFLIRFFSNNPFTLEERNYPVDFGYPRDYKYQIAIDIPEGYQIHELPENKIIQLGEKMAVLKFRHQENQNQIAVFFDLALNNVYFAAEDYEGLKKIFKDVIDVQNNTLIVFKKNE